MKRTKTLSNAEHKVMAISIFRGSWQKLHSGVMAISSFKGSWQYLHSFSKCEAKMHSSHDQKAGLKKFSRVEDKSFKLDLHHSLTFKDPTKWTQTSMKFTFLRVIFTFTLRTLYFQLTLTFQNSWAFQSVCMRLATFASILCLFC